MNIKDASPRSLFSPVCRLAPNHITLHCRMIFALPTPLTFAHVADCSIRGLCDARHMHVESYSRTLPKRHVMVRIASVRNSPRTNILSGRCSLTVNLDDLGEAPIHKSMSPFLNHTALTCDTLEHLQAQNNTIQLVAAIFAIAYGIPLGFALWLQWKAFVAARTLSDQGILRIETA